MVFSKALLLFEMFKMFLIKRMIFDYNWFSNEIKIVDLSLWIKVITQFILHQRLEPLWNNVKPPDLNLDVIFLKAIK